MDRANCPGTVYFALLEQVSDGVFFVTAAGRITDWNTGAVALTGYTATEVLGRRCPAGLLRHVDDAGCGLCHSGCPLVEVMADKMPRTAEVYLHHKDGHRVAVTVRGHALTDPTGGSWAVRRCSRCAPAARTPTSIGAASAVSMTRSPGCRPGAWGSST